MLQRNPAWLGDSLAYSITACYALAMAHCFAAWLWNSLAYSIAARYSLAMAHSFAAWLWNALAYPNTSRYSFAMAYSITAARVRREPCRYIRGMSPSARQRAASTTRSRS